MAKPGPRPTPTAVLNLRGSLRGQYGRKDDPVVVVDKPSCPTWLNPPAKKIYRRTAKLLYDMGVIGRVDQAIIAMYADSFNRYLQIKDEITGNFVKTTNGNVVTHPGIPLRNQYFDQAMRCMKELGLTPSARVGLAPTGAKQGKSSGVSRFFKGKLTSA